jgi:hypothetical protein
VQPDHPDRSPVGVPAAYLDAGHLTHGYASTIHKAQGVTVERAFLLGSDRLYREAGYTALSRARHHTAIYHVNPTPNRWEPGIDPYQQLAATLTRSHQQHLATTNPERPGLQAQDAAAVAAAAVADPADYLTDRLGQRPLTGTARTIWDTAAVATAIYRDRHHITGPDPLGPTPTDPNGPQARLHRLAETTLRQAEHALTRTPDRDLGLGL